MGHVDHLSIWSSCLFFFVFVNPLMFTPIRSAHPCCSPPLSLSLPHPPPPPPPPYLPLPLTLLLSSLLSASVCLSVYLFSSQRGLSAVSCAVLPRARRRSCPRQSRSGGCRRRWGWRYRWRTTRRCSTSAWWRSSLSGPEAWWVEALPHL